MTKSVTITARLMKMACLVALERQLCTVTINTAGFGLTVNSMEFVGTCECFLMNIFAVGSEPSRLGGTLIYECKRSLYHGR